MEAGPKDNVAVDCSEGAFNGDGNNTAMTVCCISWAFFNYDNTIRSEEKIGVNAMYTNKELKGNFREIGPFVSDDDGSSRNELVFGNFPSEKRYLSYGNIAKMVGNSCGTGDRTCRQQVHQITVLHPIENRVNPLGPCENPTVVDNHNSGIGYANPAYPVLVGKSTKVYPTNPFASLPRCDKFLVEEKLHDPTSHGGLYHQPLLPYEDDDNYDDVVSAYYRQNCNSPGHILYTRDRRFNGSTKYPLPTGRAVSNKIGKGGNGFVFTMYHERKQYAKVIYQPKKNKVHLILKPKSVLPIFALKGENHDQYHCGKFLFCFMDHDTRKMLSARDVRCLNQNCSIQLMRWEEEYNNIQYLLGKTLEVLAYLHSNGYVHRDLKASNIMIKMRCHCRPLECSCSSRFQVKLGDFDSAGTVPGLDITEPTDQVIKFASILPLGTPGYRAPEISMRIVLSGPYEMLYISGYRAPEVSMHITLSGSYKMLCTTATNIYIGKTATLKQTEEASLLLSKTHTCCTELWEKTTKLKKTKPFSNKQELIRTVGDFLQVVIDFLQEGYFSLLSKT